MNQLAMDNGAVSYVRIVLPDTARRLGRIAISASGQTIRAHRDVRSVFDI